MHTKNIHEAVEEAPINDENPTQQPQLTQSISVATNESLVLKVKRALTL